MGLLSFLKRRPGADAANAGPVESADALQQARLRARRRLIGASVLVIAGVVGFPLVFETQPRPVPVDIPIEFARQDVASASRTAPRARPSPSPAATASSGAPTPAASVPRAPVEPVETAAEAGRDVTPVRPTAPPAGASRPAPAVAEPPKRPPASAPSDAQRAQALLEGRTLAKTATTEREPAKEAGRYVVQIGAFADVTAARETRGKVEKLGLKTYTQVVETSSGNRIRVRAGPFASRDEADKALARAKAAGLNAVVLTL